MIHKSSNIIKLTTPLGLTPYLQMLTITSQPLNSILILQVYMPTHDEDLHLMPLIQPTIESALNKHPTHLLLLTRDFIRGIFLTSKQCYNTTSTPSREDLKWKDYTNKLDFVLIPNTSHFSRQRGPYYTHITGLFDGFYIDKNTHNMPTLPH